MFRILAAFLVLIAHFSGWFVGGISNPYDESKDLSFRTGQMIMEAFSVVCVNCFLIISGWYGIRLKLKSVWKLYITLLFIYVPFQLVVTFYTGQFSLIQLVDNLLVFTRESYFVQCYVVLMFLSPIINSFFDKYGKRTLWLVLVIWGIEFFMDTIRGNISLGINDGYSLIHFIIMYMLARVAALHKDELMRVARHNWIIGYFVCAGLVCIEHLLGYKHTWAYSNPVVVLESFCLFFSFLYKPFYSKTINWLAGGAFAVYIIHTCPPVYDVLVDVDNRLLSTFNYFLYLPFYILICVLVYIVGTCYDKCREKLLSPLTDKVFTYLNRKLNSFFIYE